MSDTDHRYGDAPLGRSVEEIEREGGNLVNSPVQGEDRRDDGLPLAVPLGVAGTGVGAPVAGNFNGSQVLPTAGLIGTDSGLRTQEGSDADDGRAHENRDSSEGTV